MSVLDGLTRELSLLIEPSTLFGNLQHSFIDCINKFFLLADKVIICIDFIYIVSDIIHVKQDVLIFTLPFLSMIMSASIDVRKLF